LCFKEYYRSGGIYVGDFFDGKRNGNGVYTYPEYSEFATYEGEWEDDRPNGKGRVLFSVHMSC